MPPSPVGVSARGGDYHPARRRRTLLMVVPAQHQIGSGRAQGVLGPSPVGQAHPTRDLTPEDVVVEDDYLEARRRGLEPGGDPLHLRARQVPLHGRIPPELPGHRAEGHAVTGPDGGNHEAGQLERRRQVVTEIAAIPDC